MKKIEVDYDLSLFLYAYLRHLDLSLDRSRWTSWDKLQDYYSKRINPDKVRKYLQKKLELPSSNLEKLEYTPEKVTSIKKIGYLAIQKRFLNQNELLYCCLLLSIFDKELKLNNTEYNQEREKLRINIALFYDNVLSLLISKKDLDKLMRIEHFEQNEILDTVSIDQFLPKDF